jgi:LPXTG-motif cell wall-anchored protein
MKKWLTDNFLWASGGAMLIGLFLTMLGTGLIKPNSPFERNWIAWFGLVLLAAGFVWLRKNESPKKN